MLPPRDRRSWSGAASTWSASEELKNLGRAFGVEFHHIAGAQLFEQLLDVLVPETDAAVRFRESDRARIVGAVNAEPLDAQANPSRANRIAGAGSNDLARPVVGRVGDAGDDAERPDGTPARPARPTAIG